MPAKRRRTDLAGDSALPSKDPWYADGDDDDDDDNNNNNSNHDRAMDTGSSSSSSSSSSSKLVRGATVARSTTSKSVSGESDCDDVSSDDDDGSDYVRWFWAGDSGGGPAKGGGHQDVFVEYDRRMCVILEKALNSMKRKVRVDKERFVDLQNMLQRRFDDVSKRRLVKREKRTVALRASSSSSSSSSSLSTRSSTRSASTNAAAATPAPLAATTPTTTTTTTTAKSTNDGDGGAAAAAAAAAALAEAKKKAEEEAAAAVRKAKSDALLELVQPPASWGAIDSMSYEEVDVAAGGAEFKAIASTFESTIESYHRVTPNHKVTFKSFKVTRVVRVHNPSLWIRYRTRRDEMVKKSGGACPQLPGPFPTDAMSPPLITDAAANEKLLYHGLNASHVLGITRFGFDPRFCALSGMFGAGIYFAEQSSKSNQYCHAGACTASGPNAAGCKCTKATESTMLLCRVALGDALVEKKFRGNAQGQFWHNRRTEPPKPSGGGVYNSVCGESKKNAGHSAPLMLREYVVYESSQVYPEYLVYFKRH